MAPSLSWPRSYDNNHLLLFLTLFWRRKCPSHENRGNLVTQALSIVLTRQLFVMHSSAVSPTAFLLMHQDLVEIISSANLSSRWGGPWLGNTTLTILHITIFLFGSQMMSSMANSEWASEKVISCQLAFKNFRRNSVSLILFHHKIQFNSTSNIFEVCNWSQRIFNRNTIT